MRYVNIVFDDDYDDADIISVPDSLFDDIDDYAQEYLDWIPPKSDTRNWKMHDGHQLLVKETVGFVDWLNSKHNHNSERAMIVKQKTHYWNDYKIIEF